MSDVAEHRGGKGKVKGTGRQVWLWASGQIGAEVRLEGSRKARVKLSPRRPEEGN